MSIIQLSLSQLSSYGIVTWMFFVAIAIASACFLRVPGILLGQLLVAIVVVVLDVQWVQSEIRKTGWKGVPDQDIVFMVGAGFRVLLINTTLLPAGLLGIRLGRARESCS